MIEPDHPGAVAGDVPHSPEESHPDDSRDLPLGLSETSILVADSPCCMHALLCDTFSLCVSVVQL